MFVHKDYQGQGIANRLLSELEKKAIKQDNQVIYSEVSITAKKFFENHGFVVKQKQLKKSRDKELENYNMTKNVRWQLTTDDINAEHPTCGLL